LARSHEDAELDALVSRLGGYFSGAPAAGCTKGAAQTLLRSWPLAS
jgi:hypothetical protein